MAPTVKGDAVTELARTRYQIQAMILALQELDPDTLPEVTDSDAFKLTAIVAQMKEAAGLLHAGNGRVYDGPERRRESRDT